MSYEIRGSGLSPALVAVAAARLANAPANRTVKFIVKGVDVASLGFALDETNAVDWELNDDQTVSVKARKGGARWA